MLKCVAVCPCRLPRQVVSSDYQSFAKNGFEYRTLFSTSRLKTVPLYGEVLVEPDIARVQINCSEMWGVPHTLLMTVSAFPTQMVLLW
jgi:hypothetical protein